MIPEKQLQEFISDRVTDEFGGSQKEKDIWTTFVMSYYDTYALLALTQKNIAYLDEDIMNVIITHKNKLFFRVKYDPKFQTFELKTIIYPATFSKCIRVVNDINRKLKQHNVGANIHKSTKLKVPYTYIEIESIAGGYNQNKHIYV